VYKKLLVAVILVAGISGVLLFLWKKYTIANVYVEGNVHYSEEEIKEMVMDSSLSGNSLYLSLKYKNKGVENIPFVDVMDVTILAPDTVKITVYEKALAGYIKYLDTYMYFDKDGCVVESSNIRTVGVPLITGLKFEHVVLGELLPVEDREIFGRILNLTKLLNKYELIADKIHFHSQGEVTLYFGTVKVALGKEQSHLEDRIMRLPKYLPVVEGKKGTLQMEKYEEENVKYTFKPD